MNKLSYSRLEWNRVIDKYPERQFFSHSFADSLVDSHADSLIHLLTDSLTDILQHIGVSHMHMHTK